MITAFKSNVFNHIKSILILLAASLLFLLLPISYKNHFIHYFWIVIFRVLSCIAFFSTLFELKKFTNCMREGVAIRLSEENINIYIVPTPISLNINNITAIEIKTFPRKYRNITQVVIRTNGHKRIYLRKPWLLELLLEVILPQNNNCLTIDLYYVKETLEDLIQGFDYHFASNGSNLSIINKSNTIRKAKD